MPKITDIKEQKQKGRFNIYLDGKFSFALAAEALVKTGLVVGQEISNKEIEKLRNQDIEGKLYNRVLGFLSYRPRSEKEVRDYLNKKIRAYPFKIRGDQSESEIVECLINKLKSLKLIDDREFIQWWISQRQVFRPKGVWALKQELKQKGINESLITQFLNFSISLEIEQETAKKLAMKRLAFLKKQSILDQKRKLAQFLAYRGFSCDTIKLVLDEILTKR